MKQSLLLALTGLIAAPLLAQQPISDNPPQPAVVAPAASKPVIPAPNPAAPKPAAVKPATTNPATAKPTPTKPASAKPSSTKPAAKTSSTKSAAAKPAAKKPAKPVKTSDLVPGPASVAGAYVNVRARATVSSEAITRLHRGDPVVIQEVVTLKKPSAGEPAQWAKIVFPASGHVFIHTDYINKTSKTVTSPNLNLRAGPGENHSIVGKLQKGDAYTEIAVKGTWMEIESSPKASAFVAAEYLMQTPSAQPLTPAAEAPVIAGTNIPAAVIMPAEPITTKLPEEPAIAAPSDATPPPAPIATPTPAPISEPSPAPAPASATSPQPDSTPTKPSVADEKQEPAPKRIVNREGIVRYTTSIQAPSSVALADLYENRTMDYLFSGTPELNLKRYHGHRVLVMGEECLDSRWPNTPVIIVQRITQAD